MREVIESVAQTNCGWCSLDACAMIRSYLWLVLVRADVACARITERRA